jgi:LuxR family maltose regulon positive regulatory protein
LIPRQRLAEQLARPDWRVALITGGPGAGKTVLASQRFESLAGTCRAWVTLDSEDDHPERFWLQVGSALRHAVPEHFVGRDLFPPIRRSRGTDALAADLILNAASIGEPLVLDQFDRIRNPSILQEITALIEQMPTDMQLIITSRVDPAVPIAQWRARSWLLELRQHDLAFTPDEAAALFASNGEHRVSDEDIGELVSRTEGWVAALRIALLSMKNSDDGATTAQTFSGRNRMIADLLVTEVVDRQPATVQQFLVQTSVAKHLDADLCNVLTGRDDSDEILRSLEAEICFVVANDERTSYRYHQLFAELLRVELERRYPGSSADLHKKAAEHLEARGDVTEAIGHYLTVGERDRAFDLAFAAAFERWDNDDVAAAAAWIDVFPPEYLAETADRMLTYGFAVSVCGRLDEATAWLDRAEHLLQTAPNPSERDLRHADALRVIQFGTSGAPERGIECGLRAVAAIADGLDLGTVGDRARVNLARSYLLVDEPDAAAEVLSVEEIGDSIATLLLAPAIRARIAVRRGELHRALEEAARALNAASALATPRHFGTLDALIARTAVQTERNELSDAAESIGQIRALMERHPDSPGYDILTRVDQVRVAAAVSGLDDAFAMVDEARTYLGDRQLPGVRRIIDTVEARWRIESGELRRAEDLIHTLPPTWAQRALLGARLSLVNEHPEETIEQLADATFVMLPDRLTANVLVARALVEVSPDEAPSAFARSVELAIDEGFVRLFLEEGPATARHVRMAADALGTPAGTRLAAALGAPSKPRVLPAPPMLLSERESAVLRYLPSRLTNKEIADECYISVNTVKTHLKGIYTKLGASTRSEAVDRARRLQLL